MFCREFKNVPLVAKLHTTPVTIPRTTLAHGGMKPEAGVAATRPEMQPEHQPTIDHLRARRQSSMTQVIAANIAVKLEFQQAMVELGDRHYTVGLAEAILKTRDANTDGVLSFEEFYSRARDI